MRDHLRRKKISEEEKGLKKSRRLKELGVDGVAHVS